MKNGFLNIIGTFTNFTEILLSFPYWKINYTIKDLGKYSPTFKRKILAIRNIFVELLKLIVRDLIKYNGTFNLPVDGVAKGYLKISLVPDKTLKKQIKYKRRLNLDVFASQFKGYSFYLTCFNRGDEVKAVVWANKNVRNELDKQVSSGKCYDGDSKYDFEVDDYINEMHKKFPKISKEDITFTLKYCWKMLYLYIRRGCSVKICKQDFPFAFCIVKKGNKNIYIDKYNSTLRIYTILKNMHYKNGDYLYFCLSEGEKTKYHDKITKGRGHKFKTLLLTTHIDLCRCNSLFGPYIYRVKNNSDMKGYIWKAWDYFVKNAELVEVNDELHKRIRVSYDKYKIFKQASKFRNDERHFIATPVEGYTEDGEIIGQYIDMYKAADATGAKRPNIWFTCEGKRESAGKYNGKKIKWRYLREDEFDEFYKKYRHEKELYNQ